MMTRTWEAQGEFNSSMRAAYRKLAQKVDKLADATGGSGHAARCAGIFCWRKSARGGG